MVGKGQSAHQLFIKTNEQALLQGLSLHFTAVGNESRQTTKRLATPDSWPAPCFIRFYSLEMHDQTQANPIAPFSHCHVLFQPQPCLLSIERFRKLPTDRTRKLFNCLLEVTFQKLWKADTWITYNTTLYNHFSYTLPA